MYPKYIGHARFHWGRQSIFPSFSTILTHHHHHQHQSINALTAGAQAILIDYTQGERTITHRTSADW
jgi:hypothetical protein